MEPRELQGEHKDDGSGGRWAVRSHSAGLWNGPSSGKDARSLCHIIDGPVVKMQGRGGACSLCHITDGPVVKIQGRGGVRSPVLWNGWSNGENARKDKYHSHPGQRC